ncbi:G-protein coupled receptor daf-37-like [Dreissena polymorpha]|uniref:G-protein coupled receptors family 1 profile domain-containing protein n=1 Tax=Dreissena polymorpha TaxID=45954 RepID=A0A9D4KYY1_DREPO|nr:G-protein coupled receptor daf-37-like [Dreissena polymorpha]KAH3848485.1 hypothetical protein DPMN_090851 [Dreissena polymorpha]
MSNQSEGDTYEQLGLYKASILIWKIVPPILILLGTIGNSLSILVLTRRSIRVSTTALVLTVLACSDLLVLYSGPLRQWLVFLFKTDVRHVSEAGCKINMWLVYSSLDFSAWILIIVTLERMVSAWLPHRAKTVCTQRNAVVFLIAVGVFILAINSHMLYGMVFKIDENTNKIVMCIEIDQSYKDFFNKVWPWIDLCMFCAIPFSVIVIGNALIAFKVLQSKKKSKSTVAPAQPSRSRDPQQGTRNGKQSSMTAMLFTLNTVFLVSTSPVSIYNIGYADWIEGADNATLAGLEFWWAVVNMFMYTNNSINFFLYCLSGTKFRKEVIRLVICCKSSRVNDSNRAQSNYTRTRFDNPSQNPEETPCHSQKIQHGNAGNRTNLELRHNGNTSPNHLHPNTAFQLDNM